MWTRVQGDVDEEYIATLHKFDAQLEFVSEDVENVPVFRLVDRRRISTSPRRR